jgi:hypothetical protein
MNTNEKRLYLENATSQGLILLYILGNTIFTILYVNNIFVTLQLGVFVMVNIGLSLLAFLMAVRQKTYAIRWAYLGIALAIFQLVRLFWIPVEIVNPMRMILQVLLIATAGVLLAASIVCMKRATERQHFIVDNKVDLSTLQQ